MPHALPEATLRLAGQVQGDICLSWPVGVVKTWRNLQIAALFALDQRVVLANGTLDTAHSRNVSAASNPSTGVYCLKIDVPVVNASATVDFGGKFGIADAVLRGEDPANEVGTFCSAADNALVGTAGADTGTVDNRAFWVTFN
jgi:hypothetical protein